MSVALHWDTTWLLHTSTPQSCGYQYKIYPPQNQSSDFEDFNIRKPISLWQKMKIR